MVGDDQPGTGLEEVWTPLQAAAIADSLDDQVVKTSCSSRGKGKDQTYQLLDVWHAVASSTEVLFVVSCSGNSWRHMWHCSLSSWH